MIAHKIRWFGLLFWAVTITMGIPVMSFSQSLGVYNDVATGGLKFGQPGGSEFMRLDASGKLGIGTTAHASAILDLTSNALGLLIPRMTTVQRNLIGSPATGLMIYNTSTSLYNYYDGAAWRVIFGSTNDFPSQIQDFDVNTYIDVDENGDGSEDYIHFVASGTEAVTIDNLGRVGVNNVVPQSELDLEGKFIHTFDTTGSNTTVKGSQLTMVLTTGAQNAGFTGHQVLTSVSNDAVSGGTLSTNSEVSATKSVAYIQTSGTTNEVFGSVSAVVTSGAVGSNNTSYGSVSMVTHEAASGLMTNAIGGASVVENAATGDITSATGHYIGVFNTGAGDIQNAQGLVIDDIFGGTVSNTALRTMSGDVYFNDGQDVTSNFVIRGGGSTDLFFTDPTNDRVGILTPSPSSTFSVGPSSQFQINSTGDIVKLNNVTTTFPSSNASGVLTNNGSGTLTWTPVSGALSGGTSGYIPRWTGGNTQSLSLLYDDGSNVGLGTTSPSNRFDVRNSSDVFINASSSAAAFGTLAGLRLSMFDSYVGVHWDLSAEKSDGTANSGASDLVLRKNFSTGGGYINLLRVNSSNDLVFNQSKTSGSGYGNLILLNGNMGVGTTTVSNKLDVEGAMAVGTAYSGAVAAPSNGLIVEGDMGIGTSAPNAKLELAKSTFFQLRLNRTGATDNSSEVVFAKSGADKFALGIDYNYGSVHDFYIYDYIASVARLYINSSGSIGIGNTNPTSLLSLGASSQFQVNSSGNIVKLNNVTTSFPGSNSAGVLTNDGTGTLTWNALPSGASAWTKSGVDVYLSATTDEVGIGTSSPSFPLHVQTSTALRAAYVYDLTTGGSNTFGITGGASGTGAGTRTGASFDASGGTTTNIGSKGYAQDAANNYGIYGQAGGTGTNNIGGYFTASGGTNNYAAIFSSGNVGIGTTTPSAKLELVGEMEIGDGTYSEFRSTNDVSQMGFYSSLTPYKGAYMLMNSAGHFDTPGSINFTHGDYTDVAPSSNIFFRYANNGSVGIHFTMTSTGRLGIGTTTPESPLHSNSADWIKASFSTDAVATLGRIGVDGSGMTMGANVYWNGSSWAQDDATKPNLAIINHLVNNRIEFRVDPADADATMTTAMVINTSGNVGIGTTSPGAMLDLTGTFRLGTSGAILNKILKVTVNVDPPSLGSGTTGTTTVAVANAAVGGSVIVSPSASLGLSGYGIAYAHVSSAGNVTITFINAGGPGANPAAQDFYITVIQ